ncbi:MAG: hypothetical protein RLZZ380_934, partial [Actinomycetota bacterium]
MSLTKLGALKAIKRVAFHLVVILIVITISPIRAEGATTLTPDLKTGYQLSSGYSSYCALAETGSISCWGWSDVGEYFMSPSPPSTAPIFEKFSVNDTLQVERGYGTTCLLKSDGSVRCKGYNESGQLGKGDYLTTTSYSQVTGINSAIQISKGSRTACAVLEDGTVRCWGSNNSGQLGSSSSILPKSNVPVTVPNVSNAVEVSVGPGSVCALISDKTIKCWGSNSSGALGRGDGTFSDPGNVSGINNAIAVDVGSAVCATLETGLVKCWGNNNYGILGTGNKTPSSTPVLVDSITNAVKVGVGSTVTCALLGDGNVKCWGSNSQGGLGNGTQSGESLTPVAVSLDTKAQEIAVTTGGACVVDILGAVYCWGLNEFGELGDGGSANSNVPKRVNSLPRFETVRHRTSIEIDWLSSLSRSVDNLRGYSTRFRETQSVNWSENIQSLNIATKFEFTNLEPATEYEFEVTPLDGDPDATTLTFTESTLDDSNISTQAPTDFGVQLSVGGYSICATSNEGMVKCIGNNNFGQLGNGLKVSSNSPVAVDQFVNALEVDTGGEPYVGGSNYTTCGLNISQEVWCWGSNQFNQLGNGGTIDSSVPVKVSGVAHATQVTVGDGTNCALIDNGNIYCWGLTRGTLDNRSTRGAALVNMPPARQVSVGGRTGCATSKIGQVHCWGMNNYGQAGQPTTTTSFNSPALVNGISDANQVTVGDDGTCSLIGTGQVKCWGSNTLGALGNGTNTSSYAPVLVTGLSDATQIDSGRSFNCALKQTGEVMCWGVNNYGQLGNGSTANSNVPVMVSGITTAVQITLGYENACALLVSGKTFCWGRNNFGQLGQISDSFVTAPKALDLHSPFDYAVTSSTVSASWRSGLVTRKQELSGYKVESRSANNQDWTVGQVLDGNSKTFSIESLEPGTEYDFRVTPLGVTSLSESLLFSATTAVGTQTNTPTPTISGTFKVGSTLTAVPGDWGQSVQLSYQWLRNGQTIPNATTS